MPPLPSHTTTRAALCFHRRGITLVELLVALAIVCILCGLLVPTIGKVRDAARKTACVNNLKQVGTAYAQYAADYKGDIAASWYSGVNPDLNGPKYLFPGLSPYLTSGRYPVTVNAVPPMTLAVAWCPAFLLRYTPSAVGSAQASSYSENSYIVNGLAGRAAARKFIQLESPSKTPLLVDGIASYSGNAYISSLRITGDAKGAYHNDGANYLFADFHVAWVRSGSADEPKMSNAYSPF